MVVARTWGTPKGRLSPAPWFGDFARDPWSPRTRLFTADQLPLPDGTIVLASDDPVGPFDPTADHDMLPGLTTIWFAPK